MLIAFDTSVLIAGALEDHPFHARAWIWHQELNRGEMQGMIRGHGLAEMYSVLTKVPNGLSPEETLIVVGTLGSQVTVVGPSTQTYVTAIERCSSRSLKSGAAYDALHLVEAERAGADLLLTFDPNDFLRLAEGEKPNVIVPPDPPSISVSLA